MENAFDVFCTGEAAAINRARLDHIATLGLDLAGKRVLEVGGGIGLMTAPFEDAGASVLSTDGSPANVAEMRRRFPDRDCMVLDIDMPGDWSALGRFDIIFCYGTLYHLANPERAIEQLCTICDGQVLVETVVLPGAGDFVQLVAEPAIANQAVGGVGCRPSRGWVMERLRRNLGHAYTTVDQPDFPDFVRDWGVIRHSGNLRAVFVGSRVPLRNAALTPRLPTRHRGAQRPAGERRLWIDVGAFEGERSLAAARADERIEVHAFEPLPEQAAALEAQAPPNYHVHAAAIASADGIAPFRINQFPAASSLLAMDEDVRAGWKGGEVLAEAGRIMVQTLRLDSALATIDADRIAFLKIDAQGADFDVLCSLGDRIGDVDEIEIEIDLGSRPLYRGAASKARVAEWMEGQGFRQVSQEDQSQGQEANLRFARPGLQAIHDDAADQPFETIYDLVQLEAAHGTVSREVDGWTITTADSAWSYAAICEAARPPAGDTRPATLRLWVEVEQGSVEIGVLDKAGTSFLGSIAIASGPGRVIALAVPPAGVLGQLVVRNAATPGCGRVKLRGLSVRRASAEGGPQRLERPEY